MNIDFIRGVLAHGTAAIVIVISLLAIIWLTSTGVFPSEAGLPALLTLATAATGFLLLSENGKQAAKQAERNILQQPPDPPEAP